MSLSIRNQLPATVVSVTPGEAMATVQGRLSGGQMVTAAMTMSAVRELGIGAGSEVTALAKATEVALATGEVSGLSIRNRLPGAVSRLTLGAAMATVVIDIGGGQELTAAITQDAATELGLAEGSRVTALIKSTEVSLATG
ncbi:TOBE domain-containing protein [Streptomyces rapamycinicus]|uniref:Small-ligand-binding protein n=2 Tax=Streptomyces rapamycinicus TaxID=1226757 RepID=A0A0A0NQK2_STRRN|nr:TOBE domain-containing protein [Streptomyces rapamycinicus]AGP56755.1 small-ligand-binding protein [Streptomyces rapamycinicus NRRL 5491]MBB4784366.1 molybdate transport system regulatory protein [Streptomyces rapamycinicus]RLV80150.1 small-ligand-binding protein [Streptomyces rapamycinicus NRRL 5491]UTO64683.1 TOBE domain-containing protein [Streptomyces rapamycinicus]UTP32639.1 TOBE domain-containing protein [Streptomyces rapamycinicus NRRL 5491]